MTTPGPTATPHPPDCAETPAARRGLGARAALAYLAAGAAFGLVLVRSEVVAWWRIQEMFRFDAFHMYGVIGSAVLVAMVGVTLLRRSGARALDGTPIAVPPKEGGLPRTLGGGSVFGLGWALVGACPGPILALVGAGLPAFAVVLIGALLGTWTYGATRRHLPH
ncbi:MAG: YeeE/YedE thiosulfate transporter family protein [Trueperaceae bacterium]|nr:YeeE/YedE thiosulfate transporter family protein [Trueperaceae bacterium]